jgi:ribosomal protein S18 acetylase RimI-like enzyme
MSGATERFEEGGARSWRIVEVEDERCALAERALGLIREIFPPRERQPVEQIAMEISEKRLGLLTSYDFHLFAAVDRRGEVAGVGSGVYLGGVNTGFVTYLAVKEEYRAAKLGRSIRNALLEAFLTDARALDWSELAAVVGEVRIESPWLRRLVRERSALPLDFAYFHPGQEPSNTSARYILYRQPWTDTRTELPAKEVRQLLYAIWRRAYRVRWPLEREGFLAMLAELEGRTHVAAHPEVVP